jgi:sugar fermentation stimulation protein A
MSLSLSANVSRGLAWPELRPGKLLKRYKRFYFIQRMDAQAFRPADHIDPEYSRGLRRAVKNGIEVLACDVRIDLQGIELNQNIPYEL